MGTPPPTTPLLPHTLTTSGMLHFGSSMSVRKSVEQEPARSAETLGLERVREPQPEPEPEPSTGRHATHDAPLPSTDPVAMWTIEQVCAWAAAIGLPETPCIASLRSGRVDGAALLEIDSDEMRDELQFPIGERKRLLRHVARLLATERGRQRQAETDRDNDGGVGRDEDDRDPRTRS